MKRTSLPGGQILLCLILAAFASPRNALPAEALNPSLFQLQHTSWTTRDGAPPQIVDIAQASDGSLWLGSGEGLYRFDGFTFERVPKIDDDSVAPTEISCLLAAANGDLWIGTMMNGAILLRNGAVTRFPKFEGLPLNTTVNSLASEADGTIWASTPLGIQRFDGAQWHKIAADWGVPEAAQFMLQVDADGTLWAEGFQQGLFRLNHGSHNFEHLSDLPFGGRFFDRMLSGENWASTTSGICPFTEAQASSSCQHWALRNSETPPPQPFVTAYYLLTFDGGGNLWMVPWQRDGIRRLDAASFRDAFSSKHEGRMESFTLRDGLTSNRIYSMFRDRRDGSIWIGTEHGLDHFRQAPFTPLIPAPGSIDFGVQAQKTGDVWVSGYGGGLRIASPQGRATVKLPNLLIQSIHETERGTLWYVADEPLRIESIGDSAENAKITVAPLTPELQSQVAVQSIAEDRSGALWASFIPYGLAKWDGERWSRNGGLTGLPEAWAIILNRGPDGRLWAGYLNGEVAIIDGASIHRYSANELNIGPVAAILSGTGDGWLAGVNGLLRFDGRSFHKLSEANKRPFTGITGIAEAKNGDLWLNAWDGVRRISAAELKQAERNSDYAVHSDLFDLSDGLPSAPQRVRPFPTAVASPEGRIWFGLRAGVVSVDPLDPALGTPAPPVSVVRAVADGQVFVGGDAKLAARTKNLQIDYGAVSLNRARRVRFHYMLEGLDRSWTDAGARRQAFYNDLPPGKYRFLVSASNGDNMWNEGGATMNVEVAPAFNQTLWFRLSLAVLLLALLWALYRYNLHRIKNAYDARLEERVSERTRIARDLHDTLLQSFQACLFHLQAVFEALPTHEAGKQILGKAIDQAGQAIGEGRNAVLDLRSPDATTHDLTAALNALANELAVANGRRNAMAPIFHAKVEDTPRDLHPVVGEEVYRIAGEAIRNAFWHAEAQHIEVQIRYGERQFRLSVRDDGKGIDSNLLNLAGRENHYGLRGMRERATLLGGKLAVWSQRAGGTEVELAIPATHAYTTSRGTWRSRLERLFSKTNA
jgi:signal transduction histidine kinase/ligand-binding sensor domain-containing protein